MKKKIYTLTMVVTLFLPAAMIASCATTRPVVKPADPSTPVTQPAKPPAGKNY